MPCVGDIEEEGEKEGRGGQEESLNVAVPERFDDGREEGSVMGYSVIMCTLGLEGDRDEGLSGHPRTTDRGSGYEWEMKTHVNACPTTAHVSMNTNSHTIGSETACFSPTNTDSTTSSASPSASLDSRYSASTRSSGVNQEVVRG